VSVRSIHLIISSEARDPAGPNMLYLFRGIPVRNIALNGTQLPDRDLRGPNVSVRGKPRHGIKANTAVLQIPRNTAHSRSIGSRSGLTHREPK
jgi:hypothetical protein